MTTTTERRAGGIAPAALAALVTLVASAIYYTVFGTVYARLRGAAVSTQPQFWEIAVQFGRNLLVAFVLATLLRRLAAPTRGAALRLGVLVWLGFQAMEVLGSVVHEHYPVGLYLLHVGDALMTTLIMARILGREVGVPDEHHSGGRTRRRPCVMSGSGPWSRRLRRGAGSGARGEEQA